MTAAIDALKKLIAVPLQDRATLARAHAAAAEFHEAMACALEAEMELDDPDIDEIDRAYWVKSRQMNLGKAAMAYERMPVKWIAYFEAKP